METKNKDKQKEGFAQYYDRLARRIYEFVYYRVSHKQTAEDLTSDIFFKAFQNWRPGQADAWIFAIARNRVIDFYRSRRDLVDIESVFDLSSGEDLDLEIEHRQRLEKIRSQLAFLSPLQRQVIIMRVWDELSYQEISEILGRSEAAVKMTFSRSLRKLKEDIGPVALVLLWLGKDVM